MWINLNEADEDPFKPQYDVCVCGAGPAGITVARKLASKGKRVLLLEGGDVSPTPESSGIYEGKSIGRTYYGVTAARLRFFGGTSNHWAGICSIFDPVDFSERDIWETPGWPISWRDAYANLNEASEILDIPGKAFEPTAAPGTLADRFGRFVAARSAPTRFGPKYQKELAASDRIDTTVNANVIGLSLNEDRSRVSGIDVANYAGKKYEIRANHFVIAFGALENARFLMTADRQNNGALSAKTTHLGGCFMEHFNVPMGRFIDTNAEYWSQNPDMGVKLPVAVLHTERIGNGVLSLHSTPELKFYGRLAPIRKMMRHTVCASPQLSSHYRSKSEFACPGDGTVTTMLEQTPNTKSRITLDDTATDRFGAPRLVLDWQINEQDIRTIGESAIALGKAMAAKDVARLKIFPDVFTAQGLDLGMHSHQMGTTRMSVDGRSGVVDPNCRFHGINNLHVAGSSVFSTGGGANPTLTIVSLALRLGEHLSKAA